MTQTTCPTCEIKEMELKELKELKEFVRIITLDLQQHRLRTPEQLDGMFQKAYRLYCKFNVGEK